MKKLLSMMLALTMLIPSSATVFAETETDPTSLEQTVEPTLEDEVTNDQEQPIETEHNVLEETDEEETIISEPEQQTETTEETLDEPVENDESETPVEESVPNEETEPVTIPTEETTPTEQTEKVAEEKSVESITPQPKAATTELSEQDKIRNEYKAVKLTDEEKAKYAEPSVTYVEAWIEQQKEELDNIGDLDSLKTRSSEFIQFFVPAVKKLLYVSDDLERSIRIDYHGHNYNPIITKESSDVFEIEAKKACEELIQYANGKKENLETFTSNNQLNVNGSFHSTDIHANSFNSYLSNFNNEHNYSLAELIRSSNLPIAIDFSANSFVQSDPNDIKLMHIESNVVMNLTNYQGYKLESTNYSYNHTVYIPIKAFSNNFNIDIEIPTNPALSKSDVNKVKVFTYDNTTVNRNMIPLDEHLYKIKDGIITVPINTYLNGITLEYEVPSELNNEVVVNDSVKQQLAKAIAKNELHDTSITIDPNTIKLDVVTKQSVNHWALGEIFGDQYNELNDTILTLNLIPVVYFEHDGTKKVAQLFKILAYVDETTYETIYSDLNESIKLNTKIPSEYTDANLKALGLNPSYEVLIRKMKQGPDSTPNSRHKYVQADYEIVNDNIYVNMKSFKDFVVPYSGTDAIEILYFIKNAKPAPKSFVIHDDVTMKELVKNYPDCKYPLLSTVCTYLKPTEQINGKDALFYNIEVFLNSNNVVVKQINEFDKEITVTMQLFNSHENDVYKIYRQHGNDPKYYEIGETTVHLGFVNVKSKYFSNYAFVKIVDGKTVTPSTPTDNKPTPPKPAKVKPENHVQPHTAPNGSVWNELTGMFDAKPGYKWDDAKQMFVKDATANKNTSTVNGTPSTGDEGLNMYICMLVMSLVAIGGLGYKLKHSNH